MKVDMIARRFVAALALVGLAPGLGWPQDAPKNNNPPGVPAIRQPLNEVIVQLAPGTSRDAFARDFGLALTYSYQSDPNTFVFKPVSGAAIRGQLGAIRGDARVVSAEQDYLTPRTQYWVPDDPLYFTTGGFNGQWHLNNTLSRPHVNIVPAWNRNLTGQGVIIGIIDAGVETNHPDMVANFSATHTFDFVANQATQIFSNADSHGMAVSGVAAARGGNTLGVTGAAPFATVGSMKIFTGGNVASDSRIADAVRFRSSGAITDIKVKNHSYGIIAPYAPNSLESAAYTTSAAAGTVHVLAAGNERGNPGSDANKAMAQNNPNVITVAALGFNNVFSGYSNFGANIFVTAPSNRFDFPAAGNSISTTDRQGNLGYNVNGSSNYSNLAFTNDFGGTSSAAPLVAGVLALGKEANPNMDVRLAKHVLVRTSVVVNPTDSTGASDGGWRMNAAGFRFNQNYGFGLVNADAFTAMIPTVTVSPLTVATSNSVTVGAAIPDNDPAGISRTVTNNTAGLLEEVLVTLNIAHTYRGQLTAFLTNPAGTYTSRLMIQSLADDANNINWTFTTNAFWGEQAQGTWSVRVADVLNGDTGTWSNFSMSWRMGTLSAVPEPATVALGLVALSTAGYGYWRHRRRVRLQLDTTVSRQRR